MRDALHEVFLATLPALDPGAAVRSKLAEMPLPPAVLIRLVAIGKAAPAMAKAALDIVGPAAGIVIAPAGTARVEGLAHIEAGHPIPDARSLQAAAGVRRLLRGCTPEYLVLFLLSGGGSSLCEQPLDPGVDLADLQAMQRALVGSGLDIVRMNAIRKHASSVKGGRMAEWAAPARQLTLFVSDVPPAHPDAVASGPTMPDASTLADCRDALTAVGLWDRIPGAYARLLRDPGLEETPKAGAETFARSSWHCVLDAQVAVDALRAQCQARGWRTEVDLTVDDMPVADAAESLVRRARALKEQHPSDTVAILTAGELSCPVTGPGVGGRNQHFALACAQQIEGEGIAVLSAGTDGIDGNSPAAGAFADGTTCARARSRGLDPAAAYARSDAFPLFAALDDAIVTGPTGTNVRDLRIVVVP